jgi:uncharacterized Tic20 family protein
MAITDEIERLNALREKGAISQEEFEKAKASVLANGQGMGQRFDNAVNSVSTNVNTWAMLIHLSQFCGYLLPVLGWIVPVVLWLMKKDESAYIDTHGKIVLNWIISELIYLIVSVLLVFVIIGIPLLIGLGIVGVVFPIIGAIKANEGECWAYPMSIAFLK